MSAYDGMTDPELLKLAKRLMKAWVDEPLGSIERAMKAAAHESVMKELQRRMAIHLRNELGMPEDDL